MVVWLFGGGHDAGELVDEAVVDRGEGVLNTCRSGWVTFDRHLDARLGSQPPNCQATTSTSRQPILFYIGDFGIGDFGPCHHKFAIGFDAARRTSRCGTFRRVQQRFRVWRNGRELWLLERDRVMPNHRFNRTVTSLLAARRAHIIPPAQRAQVLRECQSNQLCLAGVERDE